MYIHPVRYMVEAQISRPQYFTHTRKEGKGRKVGENIQIHGVRE